ncbi:MAG: glycosyltransferase family 1 protein [Erysipelotrichia bacterium]|nr:glycosyltransferase family 1 protein [Erysipelotrichia bacterium]
MKKILFTASTYSHINNFHIPYLKFFKKNGFEVHVAVGGKAQEIPFADKVFDIPFQKNITSIENFKLAFRLSKIIKRENYDIISTHTSLAAFFTRLAVALSNMRPYVINTVHGYLFDDNFPFIKKNIMLLAEKIMSPWTDDIIVMNRDDYNIAKKHKLYKNKLHFKNGMGVDFSKLIVCDNRSDERYELGFTPEDIVLVYAAEFSDRKNQEMIIRSMVNLSPQIKLILMGDGQNLERCKELSKKLDLSDRILFTGYVKNIDFYYSISDICISASRIEGLPFNIMEAMYMGLPIVASKVKGNEDLVEEGANGYLFEYNDINSFSSILNNLSEDVRLREGLGNHSKELSQKYSLENVFPEIVSIYKEYI